MYDVPYALDHMPILQELDTESSAAQCFEKNFALHFKYSKNIHCDVDKHRQALRAMQSKFLSILDSEKHAGREHATERLSIEANSLISIHDHLGVSLSNEKQTHRMQELIWEINDNLTGAVSFEEFEKSYMRARSDRSGLEPSELFYLTCFLMYDKDCIGRVSGDDILLPDLNSLLAQIALDDAMRILYVAGYKN